MGALGKNFHNIEKTMSNRNHTMASGDVSIQTSCVCVLSLKILKTLGEPRQMCFRAGYVVLGVVRNP